MKVFEYMIKFLMCFYYVCFVFPRKKPSETFNTKLIIEKATDFEKIYFHFYFYFSVASSFLVIAAANDHLIEFHLTEIDIFHLIEIVVISWPNFWTLFTWSKLKIMNSVKCLNLGVWPNYLIKCQKRTYGFWQLIESFL